MINACGDNKSFARSDQLVVQERDTRREGPRGLSWAGHPEFPGNQAGGDVAWRLAAREESERGLFGSTELHAGAAELVLQTHHERIDFLQSCTDSFFVHKTGFLVCKNSTLSRYPGHFVLKLSNIVFLSVFL